MTDDQEKLLSNVLDGLDRLFDSESNAVDLYSLVFSTSKALLDTEYFDIFDKTLQKFEIIRQSRLNSTEEREKALEITNDLRIFIANNLDF